LYSEDKKFKAKMSYADKLKIPFVVFIGEDEISAGVIKVKNMESGEQTSEKPEDAAQKIKAALAEKNSAAVICEN
ncbi:MAG: His/Gly/Thr/Pro-type tRNA ligase C-terminal domain-containing protein, partial [Oscillospiraceae bacterium]